MVFDRNTSRFDPEKGVKIRFEYFSDGIVGGNSEWTGGPKAASVSD